MRDEVTLIAYLFVHASNAVSFYDDQCPCGGVHAALSRLLLWQRLAAGQGKQQRRA